jgi:hypothetical protein
MHPWREMINFKAILSMRGGRLVAVVSWYEPAPTPASGALSIAAIRLAILVACRPPKPALKRPFRGTRPETSADDPDAGVVKLVDTPDLGSGGESLGGSSPFARTITVLLPTNRDFS